MSEFAGHYLADTSHGTTGAYRRARKKTWPPRACDRLHGVVRSVRDEARLMPRRCKPPASRPRYYDGRA